MTSRLPGRLFVARRALTASLATAGRRRRPEGVRRVLVAHHLFLGDTLMLAPLLAKLARRYPGAEIVMAVPEPFVPLFATRPYGVRAVGWSPYAPQRSTLFGAPGFDLGIVPGDNRYSWLARALGARWIVAFAGDRPAYKDWPVDELLPYPDAPAAWGDMTAGLVPGPPPEPFDTSQWPAPPCRPFVAPSGAYAVLHVGASSPLKLWPPAQWRNLADALARRGFEVVWSAGRGEDRIVEQCDPSRRFVSYAGSLDLPQLWHLLAGAQLVVCPDTGVAHLGRITGAPTAALFGPGSATICGAGDFWRRVSYRAVTVEPFACRDQQVLFKREIPWVRRCARTTRECAAARCMAAVTLESVLSAAAELLQDRSPRTAAAPR